MKMCTKRKLVELFYDVASPYSWLAFETLCRYKPHWNIELQLQPVFLAGIFHARREGRPPSLNPRKRSYSAIDLQRLSKYFDIPIKEPKDFWEVVVMKGTLKPQRFVTAVNMAYPQYTEELSRQLWHRIYVQDIDVTKADSLKEAALKCGMKDNIIDDALSLMTEAKVKDRLKSVTQEALDLGAFGAPFIVAHIDGKREVFFGSDRFHVMAMVIGETWRGPQPGQDSSL